MNTNHKEVERNVEISLEEILSSAGLIDAELDSDQIAVAARAIAW